MYNIHVYEINEAQCVNMQAFLVSMCVFYNWITGVGTLLSNVNLIFKPCIRLNHAFFMEAWQIDACHETRDCVPTCNWAVQCTCTYRSTV